MKHRIFWLFLLPAVLQASEQMVEKTIDVHGVERDYLLHVPPSLPKDKSASLVFVFHGGGQTARTASRMGFSKLADQEGFIVVYPDGVRRNWNDGRNDPKIQSQRENVDDIGFVTALLDELCRTYQINPKRIYATGPSNGGMMSNRIGADLSDRFAAIAPVIASMAPSVAENFHPSEPISVLTINGTEDPLVPFNGGEVTFLGRERGIVIPTSQTVQMWVAHDGCNPKPIKHDLSDKDPEDETRTAVAIYSGGKNNTEVVVYTIEGGGHAWPGGSQYLPKRMIGRVCRDFDATETIWEFFKAHPKP